MISIQQLLKGSRLPNSPTERLDVELLLAAALNKPTSYLHTWPEKLVDQQTLTLFNDYLQKRLQGEPIAYILGEQGFWSLDLQVGKQTLIPRPDTELLVETCLNHTPKDKVLHILDLGTGTGAIALAIASERPLTQVVGVDFIEAAIQLAEKNLARLKLTNVEFIQSNWFSHLIGQQFNIIVSNPPYIASDDPHLVEGDVRFEPKTALISGKDGLDDIRKIIQQAPDYLLENGWLFFEHGYQQAKTVQELLAERGFTNISTYYDLGGNERVTGGQWL
ncbi:peptide chain release factor N(5)-glutamine methyltransferase [Entomomonas asaccharolytica]|uniref:Release factor glutamine methyltransferase n=1 Tax=Entomomonas asaccharolytica TaxID=2785331 RepID=A0A974NGN0_9GAMM|nr:peptide chain release factor N(5)-glutamine methyltransferase [Entomomonas asaccharolytica]QQP86308.1 peptide chain release factor N(5)-glutamine methyltransferase [Entomomonas asaccharolytica]